MTITIPPIAVFLAGMALLKTVWSDPPLPRRSRQQWLEMFDRWAGPASAGEEQRIERSVRMVRRALASLPQPVKIVAQGSSINNTNIKRASDVDLVVVQTEPPWTDPALCRAAFEHAHEAFRAQIAEALKAAFGADAVMSARCCLKVAPSSVRVPCDVVPALRLHRPSGLTEAAQGIAFITADGEVKESFPELHLAAGRAKNVATNYRYKEVVRILKLLRRDVEEGAEALPSSFEIEALVSNVPNEILKRGDLVDAVAGTAEWLRSGLKKRETANAMMKPDGLDHLYPAWPPDGWLIAADPPERNATARAFVEQIAKALDGPLGF